MLVNDTHYYLSDITFKNKSDKSLILLTSGIQFMAIPGMYNLPGREGFYTLDSQQEITMECRSSGRSYKHPNVYLREQNSITR